MNIQAVWQDFQNNNDRYRQLLNKFEINIPPDVKSLESFRQWVEVDPMPPSEKRFKVLTQPEDEKSLIPRATARVNEIQEATKRRAFDDGLYLDYGCSDGKMTLEIAKKLNIPYNNVYGVDKAEFTGVEIKPVLDKANFILLDRESGVLPFGNERFDLISTFQVLHHIRNPEPVIRDLVRILKKDGIFLLREHDAQPEDHRLIDFEHLIYPHSNIETNYIGNYHSSVEWDAWLIKAGLIPIGFTFTKGQTFYYMKAYTKK